ncbi:hypothetical protein Nepgr_026548 [Nepenthes gracilis]|uniref:Glycosyltransferase n=1 Tax=Nepenthes gracilis TaxID=150966 RepID=A0AAD3Y251_NEPGR|nr:hypothetical protein Nepgr_026548 [Nepenthes gracilis]
MDRVGEARRPHAVCVPFPSQGHVNPFMQLAKLLHSRGFHITFVNTEFNHNRLIKNKGPDAVRGLPGFRFETIPDGLLPSDRDATQHPPLLCDSTQKNCFGPFKDLLIKLNSSSEVPSVTCVIFDGVMTFGMKAAQELRIPNVQLWTASACSFMGFLHFRELLKRGILPFKDEKSLADGSLDSSINWIPGMKNVRFKDLPNYVKFNVMDQNIMIDFMAEEAERWLNSSSIIFNTFDALEQEVLNDIRSRFPGNVYQFGPLTSLIKQIPDTHFKSSSSSLWKEDSKCLEWLDSREPSSVIYVNYGSITVMNSHHIEEFAWGLANSNHPFLWIIRPDILMGNSVNLEDEFLEGTKDRGLMVSWCPQEKVLSHPSVGAFLTHCGWNSMLEAVTAGVPIIGWPFVADQFPNCRYACTEWGIGMEVGHDVKREDIEGLIKEVMEGTQGKQMRGRAREWKKKAEQATNHGGSSHDGFERFISETSHLGVNGQW